jgi:HK97 family phage major capsid protein
MPLSIEQLVATRETECDDLERRQRENLRETELILDTATRDGRTNLTVEEGHRVKELQSARDRIRRDLATAKQKRDEARGIHQEEVDRMSAAQQITPTNARTPAYDRVARVVAEERTYRPDDQRSGKPSFFRDLALGQCFRDPAAGDRLARHAHENEVDGLAGPQERAIGTGAVSGLVPPAYVTEQFAELARAGRPVANAVQSMPLPDTGMTVNVSRITTGTSAASQATENQAVSETNADDTLLSPPVVTIAGQQSISRQAVERGELVEQVLTADLANAHNTELDRQVINGSGASGQHLGILGTSGVIAVSYTDATPTAGELWPKLVDAVRQVGAQRFANPNLLVMNPLAWGWLLSQLDTTGRPLFAVGGSEGMFNTEGASDTAGYDMSGRMLGCKVVVSGNVPTNLGGGTNESRIIAMRAEDSWLYEDANAPIYIRAEQPLAASLGVLFVAYSYSAFSAGRQPKSVAVVSGTGMVIPAAL